MAEKDYVLCMYDIRGKQEFIYKSSKLKEIVGASLIIRDLFKDYLYDAAKVYRDCINEEFKGSDAVFRYDPNEDKLKKFSFKEFEERMNGNQYIGEIVYDGGGNFLMLYKNEEAMKKTTEIFTKKILKEIGTLRVVATYIGNIREDNYHSDDSKNPGDYERLYQRHRFRESTALCTQPYGSLPIVQTSPVSSMPLTYMYDHAPKDISASGKSYFKCSTETNAKLKKYWEEAGKHSDEMGETILDNIVAETKGEDSMLAIFYIDGNAMGAKVQACLNGKKNYDDCVNLLREFSKKIQKTFIDDRKKDMLKEDEKQSSDKKHFRSRILIGAGDEMTIICRADESYEIIKEYLSKIPSPYSSCAGAAIFHSHTPFSDAYRIAEQCCEDTCKNYMKENGLTLANLMDFEYCQGGIGFKLSDIRKENGDDDNSRPWLVESNIEEKTSYHYKPVKNKNLPPWEKGKATEEADNKKIIEKLKGDNLLTLGDVEDFHTKLSLLGRSNIKGLAIPVSLSESALRTELRRIIAHMSKDKKESMGFKSDIESVEYFINNKKLLKDLVRMYDTGYGKAKEEEEENAE
ncbi:hypothetical protein EHW90_06310 [Lachnoanaerobaculum orale]|uniref:Uncharacterized protein n=1 Tax=Lachnoanaerobaculum orale TaxID=979627 RepID=A0A3P3Q6D1_9FIRM|nr:hypothetical protein [Lachnoanaerobaculum orale]RRJ16598.1 hypothetical protein EHW90_06310 [Lachnoanaerobaculum orale]